MSFQNVPRLKNFKSCRSNTIETCYSWFSPRYVSAKFVIRQYSSRSLGKLIHQGCKFVRIYPALRYIFIGYKTRRCFGWHRVWNWKVFSVQVIGAGSSFVEPNRIIKTRIVLSSWMWNTNNEGIIIVRFSASIERNKSDNFNCPVLWKEFDSTVCWVVYLKKNKLAEDFNFIYLYISKEKEGGTRIMINQANR